MAIWNINGNRRTKSSYGLLKEDDDEDGEEEDEDDLAFDHRRKSTSLPNRRDMDVENSKRSSRTSTKTRSRSLDSRITEDMIPYTIQRQMMPTEELGRLLSPDRRPSPGERGLSWTSGQWTSGQWSPLEQEEVALISPHVPLGA